MWTEQNLSDAMQLLLDSESIEKVVTDESSYVVASGISYTDELYSKALDELISRNQLLLAKRAGERTIYKHPENLNASRKRRGA